jgi:hypothetical protein
LVATSEVIWHLGSTAVLGLNPEIVMKIGNDIDIGHNHTLEYIKHHAPRVPIPDIHGVLNSLTATAFSSSCHERLASLCIQNGSF